MSAVAIRPAEAEREKLLWAMARVAGRRGYRAASVAEAIAGAKSCRASFERHFADKQECFAAAQVLLAERALAAVQGRMATEGEWRGRVIAGLARALELCEEHPEPARALLVGALEAGAEGARRRLAMIERFAELIAPEPELAAQLPPRAALMAASGVIGLLGEELGHGAATDLATLAPELGFALLVPLLGPVAAAEELGPAGVGVAR